MENFLNSTPADRHFSVVVDQNDRATIRLGNGVQGAIPAGTVTITTSAAPGEPFDGPAVADPFADADGS